LSAYGLGQSMGQLGFSAAAPFSLVVLWAVLVLVVDLWLPSSRKRMLPWFSLAGVVLTAVLLVAWWGRTVTGFGGAISLDKFSIFFDVLFLLGTGLVILLSSVYARKEAIERGEYYALMLFSTSGAMLMASATELLVFFLGLEILSVSLYVLTGFFRERGASAEAAVKYFILGAFASAFFVYGIAFLYGAAGNTTYDAIREAVSSRPPGVLVFAGSALLLVGLLFKLGSVPFHMWVPDAYEGAPTTITGYMSVISKAAAFAGFVRIFGSGLSSLAPGVSDVLWVLAIATMTLGNVAAIAQSNIKRMLAYSSIAHAGYVLVALTAAGSAGYSSVLFYALSYAFMTLGAFGVVTLLRRSDGEALEIVHYAGLAGRHPALAAAMAVFMVSLSGIPPTAGFFAKFYVFSAAVGAGYVDLAIIGVLNSLVSVYFYMRLVFLMYMKDETQPLESMASLAGKIALAVCVLGTILIGVLPSGFARIAASSIAAIF